MRTVAGVFSSKADAESAMKRIQAAGIPRKHIVLLTPNNHAGNIPTVDAEQPGMGTTLGGVIGGAAGIAGGLEAGAAAAAAIPGVGPVIAMGILGAAVLGSFGAGVGVVVGGAVENAMSEGLPTDEIFVYEDALRKGDSVLLAFAEEESTRDTVREVMRSAGADSVDEARKEWWIGLRSAEKEHYTRRGGDFDRDEEFYRRGFEVGMNSRFRCREYDQVLGEMEVEIDGLRRRYPGANVEGPFRRGYERARDHYQSLCNRKAA